MIDLGNLQGLHDHDHQLAAYCSRCDAWRMLPLGESGWGAKGTLSLAKIMTLGEKNQK